MDNDNNKLSNIIKFLQASLENNDKILNNRINELSKIIESKLNEHISLEEEESHYDNAVEALKDIDAKIKEYQTIKLEIPKGKIL